MRGDLNWAERWKRRAERRPVLVIILFAAVVVSSVVILVDAGRSGWDWYDRRTHWREKEYDLLTELKAGFALEKFVETLGSPTFQRVVDGRSARPFGEPTRSRWTESSFRRRGYWVQAVSDDAGTVVVYAVTACDRSFQPTFLSALTVRLGLR